MRLFWFSDPRDLAVVSAAIADEFGVTLEGDEENVYEWFEGANADASLAFNVSRDHTASRLAASNPVKVIIDGDDGDGRHDEIGRRLARCVGRVVHWGEQTYLGGDAYALEAIERFAP
jgi:hypothetical protein